MSNSFYREQAEKHRYRPTEDGEPILISTRWPQRTATLLGGILLIAAAAVLVVSVPRYAVGTAEVRALRRVPIIAPTEGVIDRLLVVSGDHVQAGQVVARLRSDAVEARHAAAVQSFEQAVVAYLLAPRAPGAQERIAASRSELRVAEAALKSLEVTSPSAAVIGDVRADVGQAVVPGQTVLSAAADDSGFVVVATLPGEHRPNLAEGQALQFVLDGYPNSRQTLSIDAIDTVVSGGDSRTTGPGGRQAGTAPSVIVRATIPGRDFVVDGTPLRYYDGMAGTVTVAIRHDRLLRAVFPGQ